MDGRENRDMEGKDMVIVMQLAGDEGGGVMADCDTYVQVG